MGRGFTIVGSFTPPNWRAELRPDWQSERCFIVAGGPSVLAQNLEQLRGRKVIAINSSYERVPWADVLFFGDNSWWRNHRKLIELLPSQLVTVAQTAEGERIHKLAKSKPPGLCDDRARVTFRRTSLTGAINLAVHFGSRSIAVLGADGCIAPDGRAHHHRPHPKPPIEGCFDLHREEIESLVEPLQARGVEVLNCSSVSVYRFWPIIRLEQAL